MAGLVPDEFINNASWLVKLSLFELTETLIRIFNLGTDNKELTYLQSFQDVVLEFGGKEKNDIDSFLKWWDEIKDEKSIQVAANTEAINIYTIHKSKGLQFKYVILPFCSWIMDHEIQPLLWVKSNESPFDQLGYLAVRNGSELKESFFRNDYQQEFTRIYLDNLNILYVALTRAEEGLIVMAPLPKQRKAEDTKIGNVGQLLYEAIKSSDNLLRNFDTANAVYSIGSIKNLAERNTDNELSPVSLDQYQSNDWRKSLVIRREGKEFFAEEKSGQRKRINYGILIHTALSRINYKDDAEDVLQKINYEGLITEDERQPLHEKIKAMMADPVIAQWFNKDWNVRTETPVILPHNKLARIDRVVSKEVTVKGQLKKKAIVIDYKTGEKKSADRAQVEEYTGILSSMGYVDVEGFLLYVDTLEVINVVSKMNLSLGL
jgi:ATP-dependent helicase/nuclease subunit A